MKYFFIFMLMMSSSAFAKDVICSGTVNSEYNQCLTQTLKTTTESVDKLYQQLTQKLNQEEGLQIKQQLINSHTDWEKQSKLDCQAYASFIDRDAQFRQSEYDYCLISNFQHREDYYNMMLDMINTMI